MDCTALFGCVILICHLGEEVAFFNASNFSFFFYYHRKPLCICDDFHLWQYYLFATRPYSKTMKGLRKMNLQI